MTTNAPRAAIDFDAFERDLRQVSRAPSDPQTPSRSDPLAELARIVGHDDPFRALLAAEGTTSPSASSAGTRQSGGRTEPVFFDEAQPSAGGQPAAADAFDQYLSSVRHETEAEQDEQDPAAFDVSGQGYRDPSTRRPRHKLTQIGAGLGVLTLCVTGALGWKLMHSHGSSGGPITVLADKTPLKVAPQTSDGLEIPDQQKQIYERNAKDGQIKVVNREEQPLDVALAARAASKDNSSTTPGNTALLVDTLGEPRRVRTVSVKPDTPVSAASQAQAHGQAQAQPASQPQNAAADEPAGRSPSSPIPTMTMPDASSGASPQVAAASPARTSRSLPSTSVPVRPERTADADGSSAPLPPTEATPAPAPKTPQRVASIAPETTASTETAPAPVASIGGFSVQIGVRSSDADARSAFRQMQGKYSQLAGKPELIQQAEVGGRSIYRVRVGPLAKHEATTLCTQLKGAGGQCFVAKN